MLKIRDGKHCRLCDSERLSVILSQNSGDLGEKFSLIKCEDCNFVSVYPLPSDVQLSLYYDKHYWQGETGKKGFLLDTLFKLRMLGVVRKIRGYIPQNGRILDWGCGDGSLVELLGSYGFICFGIDKYIASSKGNIISNKSIEESPFPNDYFDAITCFHLLEHIKDPLKSVRKAVDLLRPGGVLIVEVPNIDSIGFQVFKEKWQPLEIPTHVNHFAPEALSKLFDFVGGARILEIETFSHRVSPSAVVLSLFPSLSPRRVRKAALGKYPVAHMVVYLLLQTLAYPCGLLESLFGRGAVIRIYARKVK